MAALAKPTRSACEADVVVNNGLFRIHGGGETMRRLDCDDELKKRTDEAKKPRGIAQFRWRQQRHGARTSSGVFMKKVLVYVLRTGGGGRDYPRAGGNQFLV